MKKVYIIILFMLLILSGCTNEKNPTIDNVDLQITFEEDSYTIRIGNEEELSYSTNYSGDLVWSSTNEYVVTVEDGIITANAAGSAEIIVSFIENGITYSDTISITVKDKGPSVFTVSIEGAEYQLAAGKPVSALLTSIYDGAIYEKRDGYAFDGWYMDRDFSIKFDITKTLTTNIALYAKYRVTTDKIGTSISINTILKYGSGKSVELGDVFTVSPGYNYSLSDYDFSKYTVFCVKYDIDNECYKVDSILTNHYSVPYDGFIVGVKNDCEKATSMLEKLQVGNTLHLDTYSVNTAKKMYFNRKMDSGNVDEVLNASVTCSFSSAYDMTYGKQVYNKNGDKKAYPASTTKVITAMAALRYCSLDTTYTISDDVALTYTGSSPSVAGLKVGQVWTLRELLYAMLLPSGNDAAYAVACCTIDALEPGNTYTAREKSDKFADLMNEIAEDCGATNSHFMVPDGNSYYVSGGAWDDRLTLHYTTANDMVKIAKYAFAYGEIAEVTSTVSKSLKIESGENFSFTNTNQLLRSGSNHYDGCVGLKTGTTNPAGGCLISAVEYNGRFVILAVMKSNDRYADSKALYNLIFGK